MTSKPAGIPILALGFRPFYLLAALYALFGMLLWLLTVRGVASGVDLAWHSHEMLFGFVSAGMAGFLLTAVRNWTGLPTPVGIPLALLALLWIAGRVLALAGPVLLAAKIDVLFIPALAIVVAVPILRSGNRRNYKVLLILLSLVAANIVFHYATAGFLPAGISRAAILFAVHMMLLLLSIVGGRVIPAFTANAVPGSKPRQHFGVDVVAMSGLLGLAAATWFETPSDILAVAYVVTAAAHLTRLALWSPLKTLGNPLLWMLPASYLWIPISLFLGALSAWQIVPVFAAIHAMTAGAMTCMMMAMMMRSSLGHTGRELRASRLDVVAYLLLQAAAVSRVLATVISHEFYAPLVAISGAAWVLAFGLFLVHYAPMLVRPRIDGRPG